MKKFGKRLMSILLSAALTVGGVALTGITVHAEEGENPEPTYVEKFCSVEEPDIECLYGKSRDGENYDNICDGKTDTKYCVWFDSNDKPFFVFTNKQDESGNRKACICSGYTLNIANDTNRYTGRNPKSWTIYGSNDLVEPEGVSNLSAENATRLAAWKTADENATWEVVETVTNDTTLDTTAYKAFNFYVDTNSSTPAYKFFKFVVDETVGPGYFQLSELKMYAKNPTMEADHVCGNDAEWVWTKNDKSPVKWDAGLKFTCTQCGKEVCIKADSVTGDESDANHLTAEVTLNSVKYTETKDFACSVSPKANNFTYDGKENALLTEGETLTTAGHFEYVLTDSDTAPTDGWSEEMPTAVNAGTYTVWYTVVGEPECPNPVPTKVVVTVAPKTIEASAVTLSEEKFTYDGKAKTPSVKVMDGNSEISKDNYTVTYSDNVNAGSATVTVKSVEGINYSINVSKAFTIEKPAEQKVDDKKEDKKDNKQENKKEENKTPKYSNEWVDGKWYDAEGNQTYAGTLSWKSDSTGWWVEDSEGWYPTSQWQKIDNVWYYFNASGYMASGEYYDGYWFNSDGSWDEQYYLTWKSNSTGWWVEDKSGWWPVSQWLKIDGSWYYFDGSGYMVTSQYIDGYWIGSDGVCN